VVDFNAETVARHTRSAEIFGELNGTQARAQKIAAEYARGIADIQKRVARAKQSKPKIYIEFGDKGPSEYSYTFGKDMWGAIADTAGGNNIAAPYVKNWGPINPEKFLTAKPDVIVISGTENGHKDKPGIMAMGIGISQADAQRRLAGFVKRKGWADIPAVKNKRVYGIYHTASRSLSDLASAQFIAKTLYPQQFADIDPNKTYLDFYRKYLPVVPDGTFYIRLK
jgi:putative periplasmic binding protein